MRIFVTGATGFVGSAVVQDLMAAGHRVLGLARSAASSKVVLMQGAEVHWGDLDDPDSLRRGAATADAVIHTAFNHDFSRFRENCENDRRIIAALAAALEGSERPLVVTSATGLLAHGDSTGARLATEDDAPPSGAAALPRVASEEAAADAAARGVQVSVVRLPPSVHGEGDHAFVPHLIALARAKGVSAYLGDGRNRWPAVHRLDAARLYRLVVEAGLPGGRYHAVAEEGVPLRDIAAAIGRRLGVPVAARTADEAPEHFGWLAHFAALDNPSSSRVTRERLGWQPTGPGLLDDLDSARYFGA